ncbi:Crossover junction endonuclease mus81 [Ceratobasidium sp. 392]|nr:Crossover junction endonuclease mus81 [Ceratobasidium sp. 392]
MPPKVKCLNPVFTAWLEEMRDEVDPDSKHRNIYNRAVKSMRAYDKYIEHPKDCAEVKFIGPRLRDQLIKRYNESQGITSTTVQGSAKSSTSRTEVRKLRPKVAKNQVRSDVAHSSSDESEETSLSRQSPISDIVSLVPSVSAPVTMARKKSSKPTRIVISNALSGSQPELNPTTPTMVPRAKLTLQPQKVAPTPRSTKRTKPAPERPRLSDFVPAPAATSDIEPDNNHLDQGDTSISSFEPIVLPAGTYTIQLILDEREVKSTKNRDYILKGLHKRGVDAEKRALEIGDVCWIARSKNPVDEPQAECVLDYIVERKRMDDLRSSLFDGRFHEQKFRLKHTGISHVYYLVEDYDTERITKQWREQINTALSSTQVIDRFFLKETSSIEDTLDYLSGLHKTILMIHKDQPLHIIPPQLIKRHRFLALKRELDSSKSGATYHTTYSSYQILNRKNGFYTLQDNMARILQCIRGLSEEKISALIERYPTPRSLYEAFKEAEVRQSTWENPTSSQVGAKGKGKKTAKSGAPLPENMLAELEEQGRRKIGSALSKHIYDVFMSRVYES